MLAAVVLAALLIPGGGTDEATPEPDLTPTVTPLPPPTPTPTVEPTPRPTPTSTPTAGPLTKDTRTLLRQLGVSAAQLAILSDGQLRWIDLITGERTTSNRELGVNRSYTDNLFAAGQGVVMVGATWVETARPGEAPVRLADSTDSFPRTSPDGAWIVLERWQQDGAKSQVTVLNDGLEVGRYELPTTTFALGILDDGRLLVGASGGGTFVVTDGDFAGAVELSRRQVVGSFGPYLVTNGCDGLLNCGTWLEDPSDPGFQRILLAEIFADSVLLAPGGARAYVRAYDVSGSLADPQRHFIIDTATLESIELPSGSIGGSRRVSWDGSGTVLVWPDDVGVAFYSVVSGEKLRVVLPEGAPDAIALIAAVA